MRTMIRRLLERAGVERTVRSTLERLGILASAEHGHALLMAEVEAALAQTRSRGARMIEVGSTRENLPGQGSTAVLADFCALHGLCFVSVDMDPENTLRAAETVRARSRNFSAINAKGEDFLATYNEPVHYAYLDAFDIDHGHHSTARHERYAEILGTTINDDACASMHLACAEALADRLAPGGIIVFDDTWQVNSGDWEGKGRTAVPYLLDRGFSISSTSRSAVALRLPTQPE